MAANLTILKSPTVMRQADGRLWSWEGCGDSWGCCHGSCTHVWNYAQAVPHLFPSLERTLRETEFRVSQDARGHQTFRAALPIRPPAHDFHAAADGQLGGIMKVYREWRISGDTRVAAQPVAEREDEPRLLHRHVGPAPHRDARGAPPQHLRHRVLGPGRHVHELLPRRAPGGGAHGRGARRPGAGLRGAPREGPAPHGDGALERRVLRPEGAVEGPAGREPPGHEEHGRRVLAGGPRAPREGGPQVPVRRGVPLRRRPRRVDGRGVRGGRGPRPREDREPPPRGPPPQPEEGPLGPREPPAAHLRLRARRRPPPLHLAAGRRPRLPFVYSNEVWTGIEYQVASHLMLHRHGRGGPRGGPGLPRPLRRPRPQPLRRVRVRPLVRAGHVELRPDPGPDRRALRRGRAGAPRGAAPPRATSGASSPRRPATARRACARASRSSRCARGRSRSTRIDYRARA